MVARASARRCSCLGCCDGRIGGCCGGTPSLDEIKASLKRQRERIQSLYVETKQECRSPLRLEELRKLPDYWYFPGFSTEEVRFAFKGEKRYSRGLRTCMKTLRSADNKRHERSQIPDGPNG